MTSNENILMYGDNLQSLQYIAGDSDLRGKVRLIYIDPPYGTMQDFTFTGGRFSTISRVKGGQVAYNDNVSGAEYLEFMSARLKLMHDILADDGSIYLHIDLKMGHYIKVLMDEIFGQQNFINDITRIKCNPKNFSRKGYGNVKDMILFYSKTKNYVSNEPREKITATQNSKRFKQFDDNGRRFTTTPLHAPGQTNKGDTGKPWRGMLPPAGRHWCHSPHALEEMDKDGLIHWSSTGNPRKIIYADDVMDAGTKMQDIWLFKDPQNPRYPTEKNMDMLKTVISASSNEGDTVMDTFCGSGTTLVAAQELKRNFIGMDASAQAIAICKERLADFNFKITADMYETDVIEEQAINRQHASVR